MKVAEPVRSGTRVELPAPVGRPFEVYVNGVAQREGVDFHVDGRALVFTRELHHEGKLGFWRWASITFGVAADYSINMLQRYQTEPHSSLELTLSRTGGAVALCSASTIIGYASLIMAQNQALFSFGVLAIAGELMCLSAAVIGLPAVLALRQRRNREARGELSTAPG